MTWLLGLAFAQDTIVLSGTIHGADGPVRVELLLREGPSAPVLLAWEGMIQAPGDFAIAVPADLGEVRLRAAADPAGDGIGPDDVQTVHPEALYISRSPIDGLSLNLERPSR